MAGRHNSVLQTAGLSAVGAVRLIATMGLEFPLTARKINHLYFSNRDKTALFEKVRRGGLAIFATAFWRAFRGTATPSPRATPRGGSPLFPALKEADTALPRVFPSLSARHPFAQHISNRHNSELETIVTRRKHTRGTRSNRHKNAPFLSPFHTPSASIGTLQKPAGKNWRSWEMRVAAAAARVYPRERRISHAWFLRDRKAPAQASK
jgi:hypothetical protein